MNDLLQRVQRQLDANHYIEAEDIQKLIDAYKNQLKYIKQLEKELPSDYTSS